MRSILKLFENARTVDVG